MVEARLPYSIQKYVNKSDEEIWRLMEIYPFFQLPKLADLLIKNDISGDIDQDENDFGCCWVKLNEYLETPLNRNETNEDIQQELDETEIELVKKTPSIDSDVFVPMNDNIISNNIHPQEIASDSESSELSELENDIHNSNQGESIDKEIIVEEKSDIDIEIEEDILQKNDLTNESELEQENGEIENEVIESIPIEFDQNDYLDIEDLNQQLDVVAENARFEFCFDPSYIEKKKLEVKPAIEVKPIEKFEYSEPTRLNLSKDVELETALTDDFLKNQINQKKLSPRYIPVEDVQSSNTDMTFVSEAIAMLYAQQGNIPKAIETYQKLIVLFPEKSSFFATQIEKLSR